jgi:hypothetical protein
MNYTKKSLATAALLAAGLITTQAQLRITEVHSAGSSNPNYLADWFEVTNFGLSPVSLTGWKMDDNSFTFSSAVALRGVTSIAPGQSIVFLEGNGTGSTDATINYNFISHWFGGVAPIGLTLANYGGSSVGLSGSGDGVSLFDSVGTIQAKVSFGATPGAFTFDNAAGLDNATISRLSKVGVHNAIMSFDYMPTEVGSPGVVPEPTTMSLGMIGMAAMIFRKRLVALR